MARTAEEKATRIGVAALLRVIRRAQNQIVEIAAKSSSGRWARQEAKLDRLYGLIRSSWAAYAAEAIPKQYAFAKGQAGKALAKSVERMPEFRTAEQLVADSVARMNMATIDGAENVRKLFRKTQQAIMEDAEISRRLAEGIFTDATPQNLAKMLKDDLYKRIVGDNKVLEINGKMYRADKYAELVARTRTREAQSAATLDVLHYTGEDLVRVSRHNTDTEICQAYEGKTFSVSGRSSEYPKLDRPPPFHPACQHVITVRVVA